MKKKHETALAFLRREINSRAYLPTKKLPTIRQMAKESGVSLVTMHRAVSSMASGGDLLVVPGGGIFAASTGPVGGAAVRHYRQVPVSQSMAWKRLRKALVDDLLSGTVAGDGRLPSVKELGRLYGTSYPTLKKVLLSLCEEGRLAPAGRGYLRRHGAPSSAAGEPPAVVIVAATGNIDMLLNATPRSADFWRTLDQQCRRRGFRLRVISAAKVAGVEAYPDGKVKSLADFCAEVPVKGFILFWLVNNKSMLNRILWSVRIANRPVCILDEIGCVEAREVAPFPFARLYPVGCTAFCGRDIGTYLVSAGHRHIAWFGITDDDEIYTVRLSGLEAAVHGHAVIHRFPLFLSATYQNIESLKTGMAQWRRLTRRFNAVTAGISPNVNSFSFMEFNLQARTIIDDHYFVSRLRPHFEKALKVGQITAWVGINDHIALMALQFLRNRGIAVPRRISVTGFDDIIAAPGNGLTSYNFNMPAAVESMMEHIGRGTAPRRRDETQVVHVPGMLVERGSSGMCRPGHQPL